MAILPTGCARNGLDPYAWPGGERAGPARRTTAPSGPGSADTRLAERVDPSKIDGIGVSREEPAMPLALRPLHPRFGAEVLGVDVRRVDDGTFGEIAAAFDEHSVL